MDPQDDDIHVPQEEEYDIVRTLKTFSTMTR